jgi:hypothetical protein
VWTDRIMSWNTGGKWVTDTALRRISFDETRCQGEPLDRHSMKVSISAILGPKTREKPVRINRAT